MKRLNELKSKYVSVSDYIKISHFGFSEVSAGNGKLKSKIEAASSSKLLLMKNDFPYNFGEKIEHYVLWKLNSAVTEVEIKAKCENLLKQDGNKRVAFWENTQDLKSIRDLDHVQIIVLK